MDLSDESIRLKIESCPKLASLKRINSTFHDLAHAEEDYTSQIAEIIRRDPSLTARLLQMVNSVFYALSTPVKSVEDAVFYLGTKQIKQLALATPVLEEMQQLSGGDTRIDWVNFWQKSIGCGIMTRELMSFSSIEVTGDEDYISGLIWGVGYLVVLSAFPEQASKIIADKPQSEDAWIESVESSIGWHPSEIARHYMESHGIPSAIAGPVWNQFTPSASEDYKIPSSAVYIAKRMVASLSTNEETTEEKKTVSNTLFTIPMTNSPDWESSEVINDVIDNEQSNPQWAIQSLKFSLSQLPDLLRGFV